MHQISFCAVVASARARAPLFCAYYVYVWQRTHSTACAPNAHQRMKIRVKIVVNLEACTVQKRSRRVWNRKEKQKLRE